MHAGLTGKLLPWFWSTYAGGGWQVTKQTRSYVKTVHTGLLTELQSEMILA